MLKTGHIYEYFTANSAEFFVYAYPPIFENKPSILRHYKFGKLISETSVFLYKGSNKLLIYVFTYINFVYFVISNKIKGFNIINSDIIFSFFTFIQNRFFHNEIIFWIWDFFPSKNFSGRLLNFVINYYVKRSKRIIFLTDAIKHKYERFHKKQVIWKTISLGIIDSKYARTPKKNLFGFIGNLKKGQGVELVFNYLKSNPLCQLEVVGNGVTKKELEALAKKMNIERQVLFLGFKPENELRDITTRWQIAFATYELKVKDNVEFADPSKVKLYLEFGVPVIMTKVTYFYNYIEKYQAGISIDYSVEALSSAVAKIQLNEQDYYSGVDEIKSIFEFNNLYSTEFKFFEND